MAILLMLGSLVNPLVQINAQAQTDDLADLSDKKLLDRFEEELDTLDRINSVMDEAAVLDVTGAKLADLRNKVESLVKLDQVKSNLLSKIDAAINTHENAQSSLDDLDEKGMQNVLKTTGTKLDAFISAVEAQKDKNISEEIADDLISDASEIIADLGRRGDEVLAIIDMADLDSVQQLFEKAESAQEDFFDVIDEMKNRGYELTTEVREIPTEQSSPADGSEDATSLLKAPSEIEETLLALEFIIDKIPTFKNPYTTVIKKGALATITGLQVQAELAKRGAPLLTVHEAFVLNAVNNAIFFALDFLEDRALSKTFLKHLGDELIDGVGEFGADLLVEMFTDVLTSAIMDGLVSLEEVEVEIILTLRQAFNNFISGFVREDLLGDGPSDPHDPSLDRPVEDWEVKLIAASSQDEYSTTTSKNGFFEFSDLPSDLYTLRLQLEAGWTNTTASIIGPIGLDGLQESIGNNFAVFETITISGKAIEDLDGDGILDGDPALSGWKINLLNEGTGETSLTFTDSTGSYSFSGVAYGTRILNQDSSANPSFTQTYPVDEDSGDPADYTFTPISGMDLDSLDFGNILQDQPPAPGLLVHWRFDEGSGAAATDSSGNGYTATLLNGASFTSGTCIVGSGCLDLDGVNDHTNAGTSLSISGDITVAAWIKKAPVSEVEVAISKYGLNSHASDRGWILMYDETGKVRFDGRDGSGNYRTAIGPILDDNIWHHVVGQREGSVWKVYVDGSLAAQNDVGTSGSIDSPLDSLYVGIYGGSSPLYCQCTLDDIRIYDRALSGAEIQQLYEEHAPLPSPVETLTAHWTFDESTGITAADSSGNGNTATLQNGAHFTDSDCRESGCLQMDGANDYATAGNPASLQIAGDITVAAWIKKAPVSDVEICVSKYGVSAESGWLLGYNFDGKIHFDGRDNSGSYKSVVGPVLDDNTWHHVTGQREGSVWKVYVDGSLAAQNDVGTSGSIAGLSDSVLIGTYDAGSGFYCEGIIDEVHIYSEALADEEIEDLYLAGS